MKSFVFFCYEALRMLLFASGERGFYLRGGVLGSLSLGGCTAAEGDDHANKMLYIAPTGIMWGGAKSEIGIKNWAAVVHI